MLSRPSTLEQPRPGPAWPRKHGTPHAWPRPSGNHPWTPLALRERLPFPRAEGDALEGEQHPGRAVRRPTAEVAPGLRAEEQRFGRALRQRLRFFRQVEEG